MWKRMLKLHFHTMLHKKSFYFSLLVMTILTVIFSTWLISGFRGIDHVQLLPAWYMWNFNQIVNSFQTNPSMNYNLLTAFCGFILIPFIGPLAYGDSYYEQLKSGTIKEMLTRSTRTAYFTTGAVVTFLGAMFIFLIPYVFEQILLLILCAGAPLQNVAATSPILDNWGYMADVPSFLWPLQMNHPYLFNFLLSFVPAIMAGAFSILCYAISMYYHVNRFLVLTVPGIILWVAADYVKSRAHILTSIPSLASASQIGAGDKMDYLMCFVYTIVLLLISFLLIHQKCLKSKDVLE